MLYFLNPTNRTEICEQDKATNQRLLEKHSKLVHQHRTLLNDHLSNVDQKVIDREKEIDQYKQYLEKLNEIEVGFFHPFNIFCLHLTTL